MSDRATETHGWWPYVVPYVGFLLMSEVGGRLPDGLDPIVLVVKPAVTLALVAWFWARGAYPECRGDDARIGWLGGLQDVVVGLALTGVWVAPFVLFPGMRPEPGGEFDPAMAGEDFVVAILLARFVGYALITPVFEELFVRSFVMRVADVWGSDGDFREQPIGRYTRRSMIVTVVVFTLGHVPWEWWVCVPWIVLSNLWFYHRKRMRSIMLVHAVTNASLLALAIWGGELFHDADGSAFSFWFFV